MGVALSSLINGTPSQLQFFSGKVVAIDVYNFLYQFLASLRGPDGALLTDSKGNVTSHLVGMFARTSRMMTVGIKCVFVFDGEPPLLKKKEIERRSGLKAEAVKEYEAAKEREDVDAMRKFAVRTIRVTPEMIADTKELISALGLPIVQAPSEGEAQAAHMASRGHVDFVASQDTDALLFGASAVVRNLSILGKRKKVSKVTYENVMPEIIKLSDILNTLGIDREKLIVLSMLVGTDFNVGGIKGIGPKNALKLVKKHSDYNQLFLEVEWNKYFSYDWHEVYDLFNNMPYSDDYDLTWHPVNRERILKLLCDDHDFTRERVLSTLDSLHTATQSLAQKGLGEFFK